MSAQSCAVAITSTVRAWSIAQDATTGTCRLLRDNTLDQFLNKRVNQTQLVGKVIDDG